MLVYFLEQVWSESQVWSTLTFDTREICHYWWDQYNYGGGRIGYPQPHMELDVDYVEF